jgi:hypothetical protein
MNFQFQIGDGSDFTVWVLASCSVVVDAEAAKIPVSILMFQDSEHQ